MSYYKDTLKDSNNQNNAYYLKLQSYLRNWDPETFENQIQEYEELDRFLNTLGDRHIPEEILPTNKAQKDMYMQEIDILKERLEDLKQELISNEKYATNLKSYSKSWNSKYFENQTQEYDELNRFLNTPGDKHIPEEILPKNKTQEDIYYNFLEKLTSRVEKIETERYSQNLESYIEKTLSRDNFQNRKIEYKALDKFLNTPESRLPSKILPKNEAQDEVYFSAIERINDRAEELNSKHKRHMPLKITEITYDNANRFSIEKLPSIRPEYKTRLSQEREEKETNITSRLSSEKLPPIKPEYKTSFSQEEERKKDSRGHSRNKSNSSFQK